MKTIFIVTSVVATGVLVWAGYPSFKANYQFLTSTAINQHQNSKTQMAAEGNEGITNGRNRTQHSSNELYHQGIDTLFVWQGDTFFLKDLSNALNFVVAHIDTHAHEHEHGNNYQYWRYYLTKPHPTVGTLKRYFKEAADEFNVPVELLHAIGQVENNWTQIGPSIDQGWGIMHLVDNNYCKTLMEAAQILNVSPQVLKDNPKENIRGAAALLAKYAGDNRNNYSSYEEWYPALKKFSGLINEQIQSMQLEEYTRVLYQGSKSVTLWGEEIVLQPQLKTYKK